MNASEVTGNLYTQLSFRSENHKVISANIANLNTPNYKAKELVFEQELQQASTKTDLPMSRTHSKHIATSIEDEIKTGPKLQNTKGLVEQNDGNNVSLDKEVGNMAKNSIMFDAISNAIKKDATLFKSVIDSSAKM